MDVIHAIDWIEKIDPRIPYHLSSSLIIPVSHAEVPHTRRSSCFLDCMWEQNVIWKYTQVDPRTRRTCLSFAAVCRASPASMCTHGSDRRKEWAKRPVTYLRSCLTCNFHPAGHPAGNHVTWSARQAEESEVLRGERSEMPSSSSLLS